MNYIYYLTDRMLKATKKISSELGEKKIRRFTFPYFMTTIRSLIS